MIRQVTNGTTVVSSVPRGGPQARRLVHLADAALEETGYAMLRHVNCDFQDGVMILRGNVPSYYLKQVAQTAIQQVDGIRQIDNRLEVRMGG